MTTLHIVREIFNCTIEIFEEFLPNNYKLRRTLGDNINNTKKIVRVSYHNNSHYNRIVLETRHYNVRHNREMPVNIEYSEPMETRHYNVRHNREMPVNIEYSEPMKIDVVNIEYSEPMEIDLTDDNRTATCTTNKSANGLQGKRIEECKIRNSDKDVRSGLFAPVENNGLFGAAVARKSRGGLFGPGTSADNKFGSGLFGPKQPKSTGTVSIPSRTESVSSKPKWLRNYALGYLF